jgi:hypothetical protein
LRDDFSAKVNTVVVPVAVNSKGYISELPDGRLVQIPFSAVQSTTEPVKSGEAVARKTVQTKQAYRQKLFVFFVIQDYFIVA